MAQLMERLTEIQWVVVLDSTLPNQFLLIMEADF